MPKVKGFIGAEFDTNVEIVENGSSLYGRRCERTEDRISSWIRSIISLAMQRICKGKKVLDCFTHMGTFAFNAGIAGASRSHGS